MLARLTRNGDDMRGGRVVDEQRAASFANRQVSGLIGQRSERLKMIMRNRGEHVAPIVLSRQPPYRRSQNIVFPSARMRQKSPPL